MKNSIIRINTSDNAELQGILYEPEKSKEIIFIHVHGYAGNFYENHFLDYYSGFLTKNDIAFLSFNNRGHDYISDIPVHKESRIDFISGGSAYERVSWINNDIDAAVNYALKLGYKEIYLQGHSLGCNKVFKYIIDSRHDFIKQCVLLAPCDIVNYEIETDGREVYDKKVEIAKKLFNNGNGSSLISNSEYGVYKWEMVSAETFLDFREENNIIDYFKYRKEGCKCEEFDSLSIPLTVIIGSEDEYINGTDKAERFFKDNYTYDKLSVNIIKGAMHSFYGYEAEIMKILEKKII